MAEPAREDEVEELAAEAAPPPDEPAETAPATDGGTPHRRRSLKAAWAWLRAKPVRLWAAGVATVLVVAGVAVGATDLKYPVLGMFLTTAETVTVTDATTKQPVPKALVEFGGAADLTDKSGHVTLAKVKLGHGHITVRKTGYSDASVAALAPLGKGAASVTLKPNGIKVVAQVTNLITGGSVEGVEVKNGEASAVSDATGRAELSLLPATNNTKQTLKLTRDGYNDAEVAVTVKPGGAPVPAKLTPTGKVYFQSNRTGRIDIYGSNLDGTGAEVVLAGTGSEDEITGILPNISDPHTLALVSSRDGRRPDGLHHDLFIFNTESRKLTKIEPDVEFNNFRAWLGSTLVYEKQSYTAAYGYCDSIKTYDISSGKTTTVLAGVPGSVGCPTIRQALSDGFLYSVRGADDANRNGIFAAKLTGSPKRISAITSDTTVRRAKQTLLSEYYAGTAGSLWDSIDLGSFAVTRLPNGPSIETSRYYNDSPDRSNSSFIEERDGKSELYLTDGNGGNEKKLTGMGSVNQFVQWYGNDYIVFSSTKTDENALYVIGTGGGTPVKISDFYRGNQRTYGGGGNPYQ